MTYPVIPAGYTADQPLGGYANLIEYLNAVAGGSLTDPTAFDPSGTAGTAVANHTSAVDPHGDRAYSAGLVDDLSGVSSPSTARTNLGLGGAAILDVGAITGTVAAGDDSRFADARTPTSTLAHKTSHATGGTDAITPAAIGAEVAGAAATAISTAASDATSKANAAAAASVALSLYDPYTILHATVDNTPAALTVGASTMVGRKATGGIAALTGAEVGAMLTAITPASVTGTAAILGANTFTLPQIIAGTTDAVQQVVRGVAGQTLNLTQWQNSSSTAVASVSAAGVPTFPNGGNLGIATVSAPLGAELGTGSGLTQLCTTVIGQTYQVGGTSVTAVTLDAVALVVSNNYSSFKATATSHTLVGTGGTNLSVKQITGTSSAAVILGGVNIRTANGSIGLGTNALQYATTGTFNQATGGAALQMNTTGSSNQATGHQALYSNTTGSYNQATGHAALYSNTTGTFNQATGHFALCSNTTGTFNQATGHQALYSNTTGSYNQAYGSSALTANTTGSYNQAYGSSALYSNTTGTSNQATGGAALYSNTTGTSNQATGHFALKNLRPTSKAITAFADYSGTVAGTIKATSVAHGLTGTTTKTISGCSIAGYNGAKSITVIDVDSFYYTATWSATATAWWAIAGEGDYCVGLGASAGTYLTTESNIFVVNSLDRTNKAGDIAKSIIYGVQATTVAAQTLQLNAKVGVTLAPTASLTLPAGSTAAGTAPLKLTTQTSPLTTVEQGTFELVGNSLQFSQLVKRRGVAMSQGVILADTTLANSVTESAAIITAEHGANYLEVGKCEEIVIRGVVQQTDAGGGQLQVRTKYAGATKLTTSTVAGTIAAGTPFEIRTTITVRTVGATGTMQLNSVLWIDGLAQSPDAAVLATIDTTTAQNTTITLQWTAASASNTITVNQGRVLCIEPNR